MARDHRRLRVFDEGHSLVLAIYRETNRFPRHEYVNFLNVARASAAEALYLTQLATNLGYLSSTQCELLSSGYNNLIPQLEALIGRMESIAAMPPPLKTKDQRLTGRLSPPTSCPPASRSNTPLPHRSRRVRRRAIRDALA